MEVIINGVTNPETITVKDLVALASDKGFQISAPVLGTLNNDHEAILTRDDVKENVEEENRDKEVHYNGKVIAGDLNVVFYKHDDEDDGLVHTDMHVTSEDGCFGFGG